MSEAPSLSKVDFMDLYVHVNGDQPTQMRPFVKDKKLPPLVVVPDRYDPWLAGLRSKILEAQEQDFSLTYDEIRYRVSCHKTAKGDIFASLRKIPLEIPRFSGLRIPGYIQKRLRFFAPQSGLVVIAGATGMGKSTTATALLGSYLEDHGDVCVTIEDPVEYDLQGIDWGPNASCYQFEVKADQEWADYLKMSLRWHPRYIFLGELRTAEATAQALRAATSGHLVLTTLHAGSIQEALHALRQLVHPVAGDRSDKLIADSFLSIVHQTLTPFGPKMRILHTENAGLGDPVKANLRSGKYEQIETFIEKQNASAITGDFID